MLSLAEISDRLEIQQLMTSYSNAIDARDWNRLDAVFTPDAYIDYRALGGIDGRYPEIKAWLEPALAKFPHYYHLIANTDIVLSGDSARARTVCFNPMECTLPGGGGEFGARTLTRIAPTWTTDHEIVAVDHFRASRDAEDGHHIR